MTTPTRQLNPEELHDALEQLKAGQSPAVFSADPEFQAALRLHVLTSDTEIDSVFADELEHELVATFSASPRQSLGDKLLRPFVLAPAGLALAALSFFFLFSDSATAPTELAGTTTPATQTDSDDAVEDTPESGNKAASTQVATNTTVSQDDTATQTPTDEATTTESDTQLATTTTAAVGGPEAITDLTVTIQTVSAMSVHTAADQAALDELMAEMEAILDEMDAGHTEASDFSDLKI